MKSTTGTTRQEELEPTVSAVVAFCRFLRTNGLPGGVQQTLAAIEVAETVGFEDRETFADALRAALCSCKEEWDLFHRLFEAFWSDTKEQPRQRSESPGPRVPAPTGGASVLFDRAGSEASSPEREGKLVLGASAQQRLKKIDFSEVPQGDLVALEEISLRLLKQLSQRISRRLRIKNLADRVDVRRTIRRNVTRGGEPILLAYKGRKRQKNRLVIFLDISGSMNLYSLFLVRFAYALQKHFKRVDSFLFSTTLVEITRALRTQNLTDALRGISQTSADWSGGTKIGGSLADFNRRQGRKLLSRETVFMILSDGWDTGEPEVLAAELRTTRQRVQKLIWLNPLLGQNDYQPLTRGMSAALPHIDVFASAHNLESLLALEKYL
ncbi:MAG: VWA domain-containing protein [Candidatus Korobacteraceae bacterium]